MTDDENKKIENVVHIGAPDADDSAQESVVSGRSPEAGTLVPTSPEPTSPSGSPTQTPTGDTPVRGANTNGEIRINVPPFDASASDFELKKAEAERLAEQRRTLIKAVILIFAGLNGSVIVLIAAMLLAGYFDKTYRVIDTSVFIALIAATAAQAGAAFYVITKSLFPGSSDKDKP